MTHHEGSCLCGEITYRLNADLLNVVNCHCHFCRTHSGAAFSTYAVLPYAAVEITNGQNQLRSFAARQGRKHFCGQCGTPLYNINDRYPGACMIYFGTIAHAETIAPRINIWCESKLDWVDGMSAIHSLDQGITRNPG